MTEDEESLRRYIATGDGMVSFGIAKRLLRLLDEARADAQFGAISTQRDRALLMASREPRHCEHCDPGSPAWLHEIIGAVNQRMPTPGTLIEYREVAFRAALLGQAVRLVEKGAITYSRSSCGDLLFQLDAALAKVR